MSRRRPAAPTGLGRLVPVGLGLAALLGLLGAGAAVEAERPTFRPAAAPLVGRTSTACAVTGGRDQTAETIVTAVVSRQAPGRSGTLTADLLGAEGPALTLDEQGRGEELRGPTAPVVLRGEGVMATASSGAVLSAATSGPTAGLMGAPCTAPGTSHWFPGVGAGGGQASELVLTNPDDAQAAVDLRYFGPDGIVVVPGSPGVVVPARGTRTVSLSAAQISGALSVWVRVTSGRVSATARDVFTASATPAGADWHPASLAPQPTLVVGAIPEGPGDRQLVVVNPGMQRATVRLSVLAVQGALAPAGADVVEVPAESSVAVDLTAGLAEQAGAVQLVGDQPVTAALIATSLRAGAQSDVAVQAALPPLVRTGVSAVAWASGANAELVLSNGTDLDTPLSFDVVSLEGVVLRQEDVLVAARASATRRLDSSGPGYLVVRVPDGSAIVGGVVLAQPAGPVSGLTTLGVLSPDVASRAPRTVPDPGVAR